MYDEPPYGKNALILNAEYATADDWAHLLQKDPRGEFGMTNFGVMELANRDQKMVSGFFVYRLLTGTRLSKNAFTFASYSWKNTPELMTDVIAFQKTVLTNNFSNEMFAAELALTANHSLKQMAAIASNLSERVSILEDEFGTSEVASYIDRGYTSLAEIRNFLVAGVDSEMAGSLETPSR